MINCNWVLKRVWNYIYSVALMKIHATIQYCTVLNVLYCYCIVSVLVYLAKGGVILLWTWRPGTGLSRNKSGQKLAKPNFWDAGNWEERQLRSLDLKHVGFLLVEKFKWWWNFFWWMTFHKSTELFHSYIKWRCILSEANRRYRQTDWEQPGDNMDTT